MSRWAQPLVLALALSGAGGCGLLDDLPRSSDSVMYSEPTAVRDVELHRRLGRRRASNLPTMYRDGHRGLRLAEWLDLDVATDYRRDRWALGYTALRIFGVAPLTGGSARATAELTSGAGAGVGGGDCIRAGSCVSQGEGQRWYDGVALGWFMAAGLGVRYEALAIFTNLRLQLIRAAEVVEARRFMVSVGLQLDLPAGLKFYVSGGYITDWTEEQQIEGPAFEVGLQSSVGLLPR